MKCFYCPEVVCRTEYPEGSVISVCPRCDWRSSSITIPDKIPSVQSNSLVNQPKTNIFDQIYINNEVRVDSMSQKLCGICQCVLFEEDETYDSQYGIVDALCFRSLEVLGKVWN